MIIKLRDRREINVTQAEADLVEKMIEQEKEFIKIGNLIIRRSAIESITPGGLSEADIPSFEPPKLKAKPGASGSDCQGQHSIQWAIHRYAMSHHKNDWPKYVKDKTWREKIRLKLRAADPQKKWCDHRAGECACEPKRDLTAAPAVS